MDSLLPFSDSLSQMGKPEVSPGLLLARLRRGALPIGLCALAGAVGFYVYAASLPKSYTAYGTVAVDGERMAIPELQGALRAESSPDPMPLVHTEVQALSARQLLQSVADQLHLDRDPEFNAALRAPTGLERLKDRLKGLLSGKGPSPTLDASRDGIANAVAHNFVVSQDNRSLVIGLAFTAHDPALAATFVNTLISTYLDGRAHHRNLANSGANSAMSERIEQVRSDIARIEKAMSDLRRRSGLVGLRAGSVGQQQVEDLATAASRATLDRSQIEANWQRASALAAGGSSDALASVLGSETISRLREQESQASAKVADLSQRFGSAYPSLRSAQADLASTRRQVAEETHRIVASLSTQLRVARAHEADVLAQLGAARQQGVAAQNTQAELDQLQQDAATHRELYKNLLERAQQTSTQSPGAEPPDLRVLSPATPPGLPSAPNMRAAAGMGGVGGALLASMGLLAFTWRRGLPMAADIYVRSIGLTTVATLPGRLSPRRLIEILVSREREAMRAARTRLAQVSRRPPHVVGFVGAQSGGAAAAVAGAFARCAAADGLSVLLIDGDAENADLPWVLGAEAGQLVRVESGTADWRDVVVEDKTEGLWTLLYSATDSKLNRAVGLENILVEAKDEYNLVVIGAPTGSLAQANGIARSADLTLVVLDEHKADARSISAIVASLREAARAPMGAILLTDGRT